METGFDLSFKFDSFFLSFVYFPTLDAVCLSVFNPPPIPVFQTFLVSAKVYYMTETLSRGNQGAPGRANDHGKINTFDWDEWARRELHLRAGAAVDVERDKPLFTLTPLDIAPRPMQQLRYATALRISDRGLSINEGY